MFYKCSCFVNIYTVLPGVYRYGKLIACGVEGYVCDLLMFIKHGYQKFFISFCFLISFREVTRKQCFTLSCYIHLIDKEF